jgi:hypothetical protein
MQDEEFLLEGRLDPIYRKRVVSIDSYNPIFPK